MKRIIYACGPNSTPSGGIKVILRHCELLNRVLAPELGSFVYVPHSLYHTFDWLNHKALHKHDHVFDPSSDLVVLTEGLAPRLGPRLAGLGIRYGIFVQNGYRLFPGNPVHGAALTEAYASASLVLSISQDTTACLEHAFPHLCGHVLPIRDSVDSDLFHAEDAKQNTIAYMPRKLGDHAEAVTGFLRAADLGAWEITPIHGMSEAEVAAVLRRSRLFLSFSHLEGLGLPPIEAALAGNLVVGYTGEGGNEYWSGPLFTRVESGNIRQFVDRTLEAIRRLSGAGPDPATDPAHVAARTRLASMFSLQAESDSVLAFAREAAALFTTEPAVERAVSLFSRGEISRLRIERTRQGLERVLVAGTKTVLSHLQWTPL